MSHTFLRSRAAAGAACAVTGAALLLTGFAGPGSAASVEPTVIDSESGFGQSGNPSCSDLGYDNELKIDEQVADGTYEVGDLAIEISGFGEVEGRDVFDWTSLLPEGAPQAFDAVFVKQANGGLLYTYGSPVTGDTEVESPGNAISHVSFCWDDVETTDDGTTDDGTTDDGTTDDGTTDDGTTDDGTTDDGTTDDGTTDDGTTDDGTTDDGTTDDGTTDSVSPEVLEPPAPTPTPAPTRVLGSQTLPATGTSSTSVLGLLGGALVVAGGLLLLSGRRFNTA
jgi:LPXTG-motif cell wall-anchored protein